jgi:hypothetical protein
MKEEKFYIIAAGGFLKTPVVQAVEIKESEMDEDFADFEEYTEETLSDSLAEFEQRFAKGVILTQEQAKAIAKIITEQENINT